MLTYIDNASALRNRQTITQETPQSASFAGLAIGLGRRCGAASVEEFVGHRLDRARDRQTNRTCGLAVDHQLVAHGALERQLRRLRALQYPVRVNRAAPVQVRHADAV